VFETEWEGRRERVKEKQCNSADASEKGNYCVNDVTTSSSSMDEHGLHAASNTLDYISRKLNEGGPIQYAKLINVEPSRKSVNFRTLLAPAGNVEDVAISMELVCVVHERLSDIVYGFSLGKSVAYPVVENYSKLAEKGTSSSVVSSAYGTSSEALSSPNTNPVSLRVNDLKRQASNMKLVLVDDYGKPLEKEVNMSSFCMHSTSREDNWKSWVMKLMNLTMIVFEMCLSRIELVREQMMHV
ncbi:hypothetical protein Tco_1068365, partial [Tanacetum coccineum]